MKRNAKDFKRVFVSVQREIFLAQLDRNSTACRSLSVCLSEVRGKSRPKAFLPKRVPLTVLAQDLML